MAAAMVTNLSRRQGPESDGRKTQGTTAEETAGDGTAGDGIKGIADGDGESIRKRLSK